MGAFSPSSDSTVDVIVTALKSLGGVAHLEEITAQCASMGYPHPGDSIRARLQENSSDAIWDKAQKPRGARDLFYSLDGVKKRTGYWGLRGFSIEAPDEYPILGLTRAHATLLERKDTPLPVNDPHGIVYRDGFVHAVQVGFSPLSDYPDRLLPDGRIEHIGEGKDKVQSDARGNRGMREACDGGREIPVFQSIGSKGKKRYASLGWYRVLSHERRMMRLPKNTFDTDAFVFTLEPSSRIQDLGEIPVVEFAPAKQSSIRSVPVESQYVNEMTISARAAAQAIRREAPLVKAFENYAILNGRSVARNEIIRVGEVRAFHSDLYIVEPHLLIEAKGSADRVSFRMAIGQLADYRRGMNNPRCAILLPEKPSDDLLELAAVESIVVIWPSTDGFAATIGLW